MKKILGGIAICLTIACIGLMNTPAQAGLIDFKSVDKRDKKTTEMFKQMDEGKLKNLKRLDENKLNIKRLDEGAKDHNMQKALDDTLRNDAHP